MFSASVTNPDSVKVLSEVPVRDYRMLERPAGSQAILLNRSILQGFPAMSAAEIASTEGSFVARSQGPGMLTTSHFRGGQASQTATYWEGIPIGNAMLGQQDLSLLPAALIGDIRLTPGSQGGTLGNQAVAGSLHFNQYMKDVKGWKPTFTFQTGSWGQTALLIESEGKLKGQLWKVAFFRSQAFNSYQVKDYHSMMLGYKPQENARQDVKSARFSLQGRINNLWMYRYHGLFTSSVRQIPPTLTQYRSLSSQEDMALRQVMQFDYTGLRNRVRFRLFHQGERLQFDDPLVGINSDSRITDAGGELYWSRPLSANWEAGAQVSAQKQQVRSSVYDAELIRMSGQLQLNGQNWKSRLRTTLSARMERVGNTFSGLQPYFGFNVGDSSLLWTGQVSGHYRYPTLNDWYWVPGGNPSLNPESGWGGETGIERRWRWMNCKLNGFFRTTRDLIFWRPASGGIWSPVNVSQMQAVGVELRLNLKLGALDWLTTGQWGNYTSDEHRTTMPYMPQWSFTQWIEYSWKGWNCALKVNGQAGVLDPEAVNGTLPGFSTLDFYLKRTLRFNRQSFSLSAMIRNFTNEEYQVIAWRAMPGRNWGFAIQWTPDL